MVSSDVRALVREIPDFPEPGVNFKDLTPVFADAVALRFVCDELARPWMSESVDVVVGVEARGFVLAGPVALTLNAGFVPARKAGKLPFDTKAVSYTLEYAEATLEMHTDAVDGKRVLLIDDVLATGGTARASVELVRSLGGHVVGASFVIGLGFLDGASHLPGVTIHTLFDY